MPSKLLENGQLLSIVGVCVLFDDFNVQPKGTHPPPATILHLQRQDECLTTASATHVKCSLKYMKSLCLLTSSKTLKETQTVHFSQNYKWSLIKFKKMSRLILTHIADQKVHMWLGYFAHQIPMRLTLRLTLNLCSQPTVPLWRKIKRDESWHLSAMESELLALLRQQQCQKKKEPWKIEKKRKKNPAKDN